MTYQVKTQKSGYDIHDLIYGFILRVIKLVNSLPKNEPNKVITQQLLRCATSVGANDQEADGASSKKDFIYSYTIVRKETKETIFWLRLIADTNPLLKPKMGAILKEGQEIALIVSSIVINSRTK
ncbi:MAG: four helix bundle protein [Dehalococcoidales bacterium]|jgi:four helix bundle protein